MITDAQLSEFSTKVDKFIMEMAVEYQTPSLELSAVILARLLLLNLAVDKQNDFRDLLSAISKKPILSDSPKVNIH